MKGLKRTDLFLKFLSFSFVRIFFEKIALGAQGLKSIPLGQISNYFLSNYLHFECLKDRQ